MPAARDGQRPRQEPVSCESCRKKKLKCSREQPCSNCIARGISCDFRGQLVGSTASDFSPRAEEIRCLRSENVAIRARLERLEEVVYSNTNGYGPERPTKVRRVVGQEKSTVGIVSPASTSATTPNIDTAKSYRGDFQWLEGIGAC